MKRKAAISLKKFSLTSIYASAADSDSYSAWRHQKPAAQPETAELLVII
ncbi:hypothetical protein [Paenibacillus hunanensis]|nr:hypothetical protein [Paenibacillus hunanensis]